MDMAASISPYPCTASGQLWRNLYLSLFFENKVSIVRKEKDMGKMTDNCTDTKASITVKAVFDGTQSGLQAFMKLIRRQYHINGSDKEINDIGKRAE